MPHERDRSEADVAERCADGSPVGERSVMLHSSPETVAGDGWTLSDERLDLSSAHRLDLSNNKTGKADQIGFCKDGNRTFSSV